MFPLSSFSLSPSSSPPLSSKLSSLPVFYTAHLKLENSEASSTPPSLLTPSSNWSPSYVNSFSENILKLTLFQPHDLHNVPTEPLQHHLIDHLTSILSTAVREVFSKQGVRHLLRAYINPGTVLAGKSKWEGRHL